MINDRERAAGGLLVRSVDLRDQTLAGGRYSVKGLLGSGSMGYVFRARDNRLGTEVVIKVPTQSRLEDPEFRERFLQECRILVRLSHPNIVRVIDVGEHEEVPFVVMQYLSGGTLLDRMVESGADVNGMPAATLPNWLMDIASALDAMHRQNFIHRDVKPANILFDEHGHAYLSDFGLAKIVAQDGAMTSAGAIVGSPNYTSPELVLGKRYDGRVDQYSLAITVHEVLTGQAPLVGSTAMSTMVMHTNTRPPALCKINPDISDELSRAVLKALAKDPNERFPDCVSFAEAVLAGIDAGLRDENRTEADGVGPVSPRLHKSRNGSGKRRSRSRQPNESARNKPVHVTGSGSSAKYTVTKVSQGVSGCIPCPACGRVLSLKLKHAGRHANCKWCNERILISSDLSSIKLLEFKSPEDGQTVTAENTERTGWRGFVDRLTRRRFFNFREDVISALPLAAVALVFLLAMVSYFIP